MRKKYTGDEENINWDSVIPEDERANIARILESSKYHCVYLNGKGKHFRYCTAKQKKSGVPSEDSWLPSDFLALYCCNPKGDCAELKTAFGNLTE